MVNINNKKEGEKKMKQNFELDKELADKGIDIKKYESLFTGYEFEYDENEGVAESGISGRDVANHFGVEFRQTNGKGKKLQKIEMSSYGGNKATIEVNVDEDLYKGIKYVSSVYPDGSVDVEVVTVPIQLKELGALKREVFDYLKDEVGADFFAKGKGGLHMTFLTNHHAERSRFDKSVISNLIQLTRCYYKEIKCAFPGKGRKSRQLYYCYLPSFQEKSTPGSDGKYCAINCRKDNDGNIWAVEIRMPDGTDDWELIKRQTKFWSAMIRHAAIIAKYGRLDFNQEIFDEQVNWSRPKKRLNRYMFSVTNQPRFSELKKIIESSLRWYGYSDTVVEEDSDMEEKCAKALEMQLEGKTLGEIAKGLGFNKGSTNKVRAILNNGGN
jgi:hypothetical protein|tara:strand:- start:140 stop:1291 length:1152 start_codon:yes stop_codon:yes gene_type:complete